VKEEMVKPKLVPITKNIDWKEREKIAREEEAQKKLQLDR
jgi:hypothetical protein